MILNWFKKQNDFDFQFMDYSDYATFSIAPPILAKDIKPLKESQQNKHNHYHFAQCPGMYSYSTLGYIIPAWANIWIKSNSANSLVYVNLDRLDNPLMPRRNICPEWTPSLMDNKIADGFVDFKGINPNTFRLSTPWKLYSKQNLSFLLMPAYFHNPIFNNQIRGYPGIIDVSNEPNGFSAITFIFSIIEKFEHVINVGDPLIHVIPIPTPKKLNGSYGFFVDKEKNAAKHGNDLFFKKSFYRKYFQRKKKFTLTKREEVKNYFDKGLNE